MCEKRKKNGLELTARNIRGVVVLQNPASSRGVNDACIDLYIFLTTVPCLYLICSFTCRLSERVEGAGLYGGVARGPHQG